jgi:nucleoside-diphosphate-sugar epimerase
VRILITGITGFVGPHLARHIADIAPEADIWGLVWEADRADVPSSIHQVEGDLTNLRSLKSAFDQVQPEIVFHLAAASSVASSWEHPGRFLEVNAVGTVNLLEIVRATGRDVRVVVSSSGEIYGAVPVDQHRASSTAAVRGVELRASDRAHRTGPRSASAGSGQPRGHPGLHRCAGRGTRLLARRDPWHTG